MSPEAALKFTPLPIGWDIDAPWSSKERFPVLSFFTGAGFLDIGFEAEGFEAVWHNEYDPWFIQAFEYGATLAAGRPKRIENPDSIIDIGPNEIFRQAFQTRRARSAPGPFGIIGGPPCPDFSVGGKNRGEHGDRGKLSRVFADRILELQPTFFVFENVKGLISTARHRMFLEKLIHDLEQDYRTDFRVLNALNVGVPQDRERVFIVGFHKDWFKKKRIGVAPGEKGWFPWPHHEMFHKAKTRFYWPGITPYGAEAQQPSGIPVELTVWSRLADETRLAAMPNGSDIFATYSSKFTEIAEGDSSRKSFKRLHRWRYSPTVAYGNNEVHLHPVKARRLSVREALLLQTAPDRYALPAAMPLTAKFKTISNGVPIGLARALAYSLRTYMDSA